MHQTDEGINPLRRGVVRLQASIRTSFWEPMLVLVWRELRVRYKRTALGFFWSLAPPIAQAFLWLIVVKWFLGVKVPNFSAYLLCNAFTWQFIQNALLDGCSAVMFHMPLVKAFPMRREILPLASLASNFVHYLLAMLVLFAYLALVVYREYLFVWLLSRGTWLLLLPVAVAGLLALLAGLVLALSCLTVLYHDLKFVMDSFVLRLLFFACPVIYFAEQVPEVWRPALPAQPFRRLPDCLAANLAAAPAVP
jgi:lipopolysaccharide transport system permease protein